VAPKLSCGCPQNYSTKTMQVGRVNEQSKFGICLPLAANVIRQKTETSDFYDIKLKLKTKKFVIHF
jgi:hypothetical protein